MAKYYSVARPIFLGTLPPGIKPVKIVNFGKSLCINEIFRNAWGFIETESPIDAEDCERYAFVRGGLTKISRLIIRRFPNGNVKSDITDFLAYDMPECMRHVSCQGVVTEATYYKTRKAAEEAKAAAVTLAC